jgi:thiamine monophosphate kinase
MLHGGEDYELLFAAAADFNPAHHGIEAVALGSFEAGPPGLYVDHEGRREPLACKSWDHLG